MLKWVLIIVGYVLIGVIVWSVCLFLDRRGVVYIGIDPDNEAEAGIVVMLYPVFIPFLLIYVIFFKVFPFIGKRVISIGRLFRRDAK